MVNKMKSILISSAVFEFDSLDHLVGQVSGAEGCECEEGLGSPGAGARN